MERLQSADIPVFLPTDETAPYDALVETVSEGIRCVQFERGWVVDGRVRFTSGSGADEKAVAIDLVVVCCAELGCLYVISRDSYDSTVTLRVDEPEQADSRINWAEDYEFQTNWPD